MSARAALVAWLLLALGALSLAAWGGLDRRAGAYLDEALQRALIAFASARALNGVISVAQGTELALEPAGVGLNFAPGEVLDPINDLVERFSWVLLAASASLSTQRLLLMASVGPWLSAALALLAILGLLRRAAGWRWPFAVVVAWRRALVVVAVLRFAVPLVALLAQGFYTGVLDRPYRQAAAALDRATEQARALDQPAAASTDGLLRRLQGIGEEVRRWPAQIDRYRALADQVARSALEMIAVLLIQTVLLPLAGAWVMVAVLRALWRWAGRGGVQSPSAR